MEVLAVSNDVTAILANIGPIIDFLGVTRAIAPILAQFLSILIQIPAVIAKCLSIPLHLVAVAADVIGKRRAIEASAVKCGMGWSRKRQEGATDQASENGQS